MLLPGACFSMGWSDLFQHLYITGTYLLAIMVPFMYFFSFNTLQVPKWKNILEFGCIFRGFLPKTIEPCSSLAARTVMRPPSSHQNAPDWRLAEAAGNSRALVNTVFQLEEAARAVGVHVITHR